ncbi:MAG: hypothetical protein HUU31_16450 [Anaerolineae bacterium]|nr:hypothetical protein [Anaerolineae bacterium]
MARNPRKPLPFLAACLIVLFTLMLAFPRTLMRVFHTGLVPRHLVTFGLLVVFGLTASVALSLSDETDGLAPLTQLLDQETWITSEIDYLGLRFLHPTDWRVQPYPYADFGFRISSPNLEIDPLGNPLQGAFVSASLDRLPFSITGPLQGTLGQTQTEIGGIDATYEEWFGPRGEQIDGWSLNAHGHNHFVVAVSSATASPTVAEIARAVAQSVELIGDYAPEPVPPNWFPVDGATTRGFPDLQFPFQYGPGKIMADYSAGSHTGGDNYGLDMCEGPGCSQSVSFEQFVLAPTDITLRLSLDVDLIDSDDYHIFEIDPDYGGRKLCTSLGHFVITLPGLSLGKRVVRGTILGRITDYHGYSTAEHVHFALFTVSSTSNCEIKSGRQAVPFDSNEVGLGGLSIGGEDFAMNGSYDGTAVQSNNAGLCSIPFDTNSANQEKDFAAQSVGCDGLDGTPTPPPTIPSYIDNSRFVSHVTIPDGALVSSSEVRIKTWRMQNTGTSSWGSGYQLVFRDGDQLGAPSAVNVSSTAPGQNADISVNITAPSVDGTYTGYWQLRNPQGTYFGPRIWVTIRVGSQSGYITTLTADPPSPSDTSAVRIHAITSGLPNFRAMRVLIDGTPAYEIGAPELNFTWDTSNVASAEHSIVVEAATHSDTSWSQPERRSMTYMLTGTQGTPNLAPNRPSLSSPYDFYVYYSGNTGTLCAQANGDPDGDAITSYYFEARHNNNPVWNSGWVGGNCATTSALSPYSFEWRARVQDSRGGQSDWSDLWHFTLVNPSLSITELYFEPLDGNSEQVRIRACTAGQGGVGITMRVSVNDASDGSANGQWHIIKELGVPCFNQIDAPVWLTLPYGDGAHRVRAEAHGASVGWNGAASREEVYTLPHRRPSSPELVAPVPLSRDIREAYYLNSRTITFRWHPVLGVQTYVLSIGTNPSPGTDPNPVYRQSLGSGITSQTVTLLQAYPVLYWQVQSINDVGNSYSGDQLIGIDEQIPTCVVQPLVNPVFEGVFQVTWAGTDDRSGVGTYDVQYLDSHRGSWEDWLTDLPTARTFDLFTGQPGHTYSFRCRATDRSGNAGAYPSNADTETKVDPAARPPSPWFDDGYGHKRNITILNNMPAVALPIGYPVRIHFDSSTTPTAADIYSASQTATKCDDVRVVHLDAIELDRVVTRCTSAAIDIWFRNQVAIAPASSNSTSHQLYYGNPSAGTPPGSPDTVFDPPLDANTIGLWYMDQGSGTVAYDSTAQGNHCVVDSSTTWVFPEKFNGALRFLGGTEGPTLYCGAASIFNQQTFTFELWFRRSSPYQTWGRLAGHMPQRWLLMLGDGRVLVHIWTPNGDPTFSTNARVDQDTNWHHFAFTVSGSTLNMYLDGVLDSSRTLSASIRSYVGHLSIGSSENIERAFAEVTHVRLSNVARTSFSYGGFAAISTEPVVAVGEVIAPPITGTPDLVVLSLTALSNPAGGVLAELVLQNQGSISTQNGFYTDLYLDHAPTGVGDYTGSLRAWINDPIDAGEIVTLITAITHLAQLGGVSLQSVGAAGETSGTLYAQVDSTGAVTEPDDANNIVTSGAPVCLAAEDAHEADDDSVSARMVNLGQFSVHNFDHPGDRDWIKFTAQSGVSYELLTSDLDLASDTVLELYDVDGANLLASNDDFSDSLASRIQWTAPSNGVYFARIAHWDFNAGGCETAYTLTVNELSSADVSVQLEGRPPIPHARWMLPLHVIITRASDSTIVYDQMIVTDDNGQFGLPWLPLGEYRLWVKGTHTLARAHAFTLISGTNTFSAGILKEGDANDNNAVNISDFSILASSFGSTQGQPGYDSRADFNGDGPVTIADFSLLAASFGLVGAVP